MSEGQGTEETAAPASQRFNPDLAPHLFHQLTADGQPKPGPLGSGLARLLPLLEGLEQPGQQLGTDPGPLVIHPAQNPLPLSPGPEHHLSPLAELDGVGEQVVQHLLHAVGIKLHQGRQCRVQLEAQLQMPGACLGPVHRRHVFAQLH